MGSQRLQEKLSRTFQDGTLSIRSVPQLKKTRVVLGCRIPFQLVAHPVTFQKDGPTLGFLPRLLFGKYHIISQSARIIRIASGTTRNRALKPGMANVRVQLDDSGFKHPPAGSVFDVAVFGNRRRRENRQDDQNGQDLHQGESALVMKC